MKHILVTYPAVVTHHTDEPVEKFPTGYYSCCFPDLNYYDTTSAETVENMVLSAEDLLSLIVWFYNVDYTKEEPVEINPPTNMFEEGAEEKLITKAKKEWPDVFKPEDKCFVTLISIDLNDYYAIKKVDTETEEIIDCLCRRGYEEESLS